MATAAISGVESPISGENIVLRCEPERAGGTVDLSRLAFELEKDADRGLVQVKMKRAAAEAGAILLVFEASAKAEILNYLGPQPWFSDSQLALHPLFVERSLARD